MKIRKRIEKAAAVFCVIAVCVGMCGCDMRIGQSGELVNVEADRAAGGVYAGTFADQAGGRQKI